MKRIKNLKVLLTILSFSFAVLSYGQMLAPDDPGGEPEGPPLGGGAPLGEGAILLIILGAGYSARKTYYMTGTKKKNRQ